MKITLRYGGSRGVAPSKGTTFYYYSLLPPLRGVVINITTYEVGVWGFTPNIVVGSRATSYFHHPFGVVVEITLTYSSGGF